MRATPRAVKVLGVAAFGLVWVVGALVLAGDDDLSSLPGDQAGAMFPPGTITPAPTADELVCGDYVAGRTLDDERRDHADDYACIVDALEEGRPAVLVRRERTAESTPVRVQVRVLGEGRLEIIRDNSRNPFGGYTVERSLCTGIAGSIFAPTGCEVVESEVRLP